MTPYTTIPGFGKLQLEVVPMTDSCYKVMELRYHRDKEGATVKFDVSYIHLN